MSEIRTDREGAVAILTLDAPDRRNALTPDMADELVAACDALDADQTVGAVVVRGAGGSFCAGAKLDALARVAEDPVEADRYVELDRIYGAFSRVGRLRAPTIAAVRGGAVGAGLNLMLVCDLRVVAEDARILAGFLKIGVHPGGGGLTMLQRLAGKETAAAMAIFGEELNGGRAHELGLAWAALPDDEVEARAIDLATVAASDPALAQMAIHSFRTESSVPLPFDVAVEFERGRQLWSLRRRHERGR